MANDYKGYTTFNDVADKRLQAWNRVAVVYNITRDLSAGQGTAYAEQFEQEDRILMHQIIADVKESGYDAVRKTIQA